MSQVYLIIDSCVRTNRTEYIGPVLCLLNFTIKWVKHVLCPRTKHYVSLEKVIKILKYEVSSEKVIKILKYSYFKKKISYIT